jgi:hypothetical protein
MATPRCPHCSSPKIRDGVCSACGRKVDEAVELPLMDDIVVTQLEPREPVKKQREAPATTNLVCPSCSVPNPPTRSLCLACGERL